MALYIQKLQIIKGLAHKGEKAAVHTKGTNCCDSYNMLGPSIPF